MGVTFNQETQSFVFGFDYDGQNDIVSLTGNGFCVEAFGKCFYYGYEFSKEVESSVRSRFIQYVKFTNPIYKESNLAAFIQKAVNDLNKKINLYDYDLVVMPESSSSVNQYLLRYIYRFAQPTLRHMELVKNLPLNISFDLDAYQLQYLDDVLENGQPRYTSSQKAEALESIEGMMRLIHAKDYFTIAKDVRKSKLRPYIMDFLRFKSPKDEELCRKLRDNNILVVDDVTTSGSTLNEILRVLRILNEDNLVTVFSLIGRKDLMAESV